MLLSLLKVIGSRAIINEEFLQIVDAGTDCLDNNEVDLLSATILSLLAMFTFAFGTG